MQASTTVHDWSTFGQAQERRLWSRDGITLSDFRVEHRPRGCPWQSCSTDQQWGLALPRRGRYMRRSDGVEQVVDVTTGFLSRPGQEVAVAVPAECPDNDDVTEIGFDESLLDAIPALDAQDASLRISPQTELHHRVLRSCVARRADDLTVQSVVGDLLWSVVPNGSSPDPLGRPSTALTHRRLVAQTCELLHVADHQMSLFELARDVAVSPFYLSRVFRRVTGMTISQYRIRLRVADVLERITDGEENLSTIAASTGFADHSHMTRTVVAQLGQCPSALRPLLRQSAVEPPT